MRGYSLLDWYADQKGSPGPVTHRSGCGGVAGVGSCSIL